MAFRASIARAARLVLAMTGLIASNVSAGTIDLYGVTQITLAWEQASGPVAGYYVVVFRNDSGAAVESFAADPTTTVTGSIGDEVSISVAAFDAAGIAGPLSPRSDTFRFNDEAGPAPDPDPLPVPDDGTDPPVPPDPDPPPPTPSHTALDFTGDGASDLLLRGTAGDLTLLPMDGSTVVASRPLAYLDTSFRIVGNGDYDGNGLADLLWEEIGTGRLIVWRMFDEGPDAGTLIPVTGLDAPHEWSVGGSGDFDGDGHDDILLFSLILGEAEILYMRDGLLDSQARLPGHAGAFSVAAIGDVDGDGIDEILWRDEGQDDLVLWQPDLGGSDTATKLSARAKHRRVVASGDFDGDGQEELFLLRSKPSRLEVWGLVDHEVVDTLSIPHDLSNAWRTAGVGDYDADGLADLVWFDPASGRIEIWFSDGSSVTREPVVTGAGSEATLVSGHDGSDDVGLR